MQETVDAIVSIITQIKAIGLSGQVLETIIILGTIFIVGLEVSPLKYNPLSWIGRKFFQPIRTEIEAVQSGVKAEISEMKTELSDLKDYMAESIDTVNEKIALVSDDPAVHISQDQRRFILNSAERVRNKEEHLSKEYYDAVVKAISEYEKFCHTRDIPNGVIQETSAFLRKEYQNVLSGEK